MPVHTSHDDVIRWKHFPHYWPFVRGIHRLPVNSPHKGQWRGALMFSLVCVWMHGWVNTGEAGDLRRHRAHYGVTVMPCILGSRVVGGGVIMIPPVTGEESWADMSYCAEAGRDLVLDSQYMLHLQFYSVLPLFYLRVYNSVHMFILLSCFNLTSCNSICRRIFITGYGLFCFYELYVLFHWYWLHFYLT